MAHHHLGGLRIHVAGHHEHHRSYTTVGYSDIRSIDTSDPKSAKISFQKVFVDWPDLFGGV